MIFVDNIIRLPTNFLEFNFFHKVTDRQFQVTLLSYTRKCLLFENTLRCRFLICKKKITQVRKIKKILHWKLQFLALLVNFKLQAWTYFYFNIVHSITQTFHEYTIGVVLQECYFKVIIEKENTRSFIIEPSKTRVVQVTPTYFILREKHVCSCRMAV